MPEQWGRVCKCIPCSPDCVSTTHAPGSKKHHHSALQAAPLEGLSRNKLGNNKKNKARRAEKKHKKAEKQRQQL